MATIGSPEMPRRAFMAATAGGLLAAPLVARAQPAGKVWRVGIMDGGSPTPERQALWSTFREALRNSGYVEGKNIAFELRWGSGHIASLGGLAGELLRANVDLIVVAGTPAALAVRQTTARVPIVLVIAGDPVRTGLASTLRRPGGNVTGLTTLSTELSVKRLDFLRELVPMVTQLGVLWDGNPAFALAVQDTEVAARAMKVTVRRVEVHSRDHIEAFFGELNRLRLDALEVMPGQLFLRERQLVADLAAKYRLPTIYAQREYVEAGGLMSYGSSLAQLFPRAAVYVDKILRGATPTDLPIEQPTAFELAINAKTAKALGLTIPPSLLQRADQVIE